MTTRSQEANFPPQAARSYPTHVRLHTNAPGKAILASTDPDTVNRLIDDYGLPRQTPNTITEIDELRAEIERIRGDGYATDEGELITGMNGIAVPIVTDDINGAIAVYGASEEFEIPPHDARLIDTVKESADEIEANLIFTQR